MKYSARDFLGLKLKLKNKTVEVIEKKQKDKSQIKYRIKDIWALVVN